MDGEGEREGAAYFMESWRPITDDEFARLFAEQYAKLNAAERDCFNKYRVAPWKAVIRRSEVAGDEQVFVVSQKGNGVLYFDDVEYGFNISLIDEAGRITMPEGSQYTLKEAVVRWFEVQQ